MIERRGLSVRERHALAAVREFYADHGRPPSYKEVGAKLGVGPGQAHDLVKSCARSGWLTVQRRRGFRTQIRLHSLAAELTTQELVDEIAMRRPGRTADFVPPPENDPKDTSAALAA